jgi:hypothetical protein
MIGLSYRRTRRNLRAPLIHRIGKMKEYKMCRIKISCPPESYG